MEIEGGPIYHNDYNFKNLDEISAEERAIDEWLPVTASRTGKWWYSAVHNVTVIVGAGILGLPSAMSKMGWGPGVAFMVVSWIVTLFTLWEMIEMHEMVPEKRFDRYHELGQHAFGKKLGLWIVVPQQLIVVVGVNIVYMVTAGDCLKRFHDLLSDHEIKSEYFIMIFASVHFVLSQLPSFNAIVRISLAAAIMTLGYSTITWGAALNMGKQHDAQYGYKSNTAAGTALDFFSALGNIVFAYSAHNVVLEIQASMPSTPGKPSKGPMWRGALVAYIVVALCYFPVALIGYGMFGNAVGENILTWKPLKNPRWLIAMGNMFLVLHLIGSYQVFALPFFDMMEIVLVKKLKFKATWYLRFISRNIYVAFTMFVAIMFPIFDGILAFFGGFGFAPTTYFIPCIMWIAIRKPRRFSRSWFANWGCIIFGVLLTIVGPIGGLKQIISKWRKDQISSMFREHRGSCSNCK